jgi:DNA-binding MarR family transcriptional regulator
MDSTLPGATSDASAARRRRRLNHRITDGLRDLSVQLALLSHQIGMHLDLRDADLECLDLISRHGPIGPTALAKRAGMHPATLTGVLDRLERGNWVVRTPNPTDRRAVLVQVVRARTAEVNQLFTGLNSAVDEMCAEYGEAELALIADFLLRASRAGRSAKDELADS